MASPLQYTAATLRDRLNTEIHGVSFDYPQCPLCRSNQVTHTPVIFDAGNDNTYSPFRLRVRTNKLDSRAAPPSRMDVTELQQIHAGRVVSDLAIAAVALVLVICAHWYWMVPLIAILAAILTTRQVRTGLQAIATARAHNASYDEQFAAWQASWLCLECGTRFLPEKDMERQAA